MRNRLVTNISWLFLERVARLLGGLLLSAILARHLGVEQFGIYNFAFAITAMFLFLPNLGLDQIVVKAISERPADTPDIMAAAFLAKLLGGVLGILLILAVVSLFYGDEPLVWISVVLLSLRFPFLAFDVIDYLFQAQIRSKFVAWARSAGFFLNLALVCLVVLLDGDYLFILAAAVFETIIIAALLFIFLRGNTEYTRPGRVDLAILKQLLTDCWPLMLSLALIGIHHNIDQVMLKELLGDRAVGLYAAAAKLSLFWMVVPAILTSTFMPYLIKAKDAAQQDYVQGLVGLYSLIHWLGFGLLLGTVLFGRIILELVFGLEYGEGFYALICLVGASIFSGVGVVRGIWLVAEGYQVFRLYNNLIVIVINVVGNLLLIPAYGILGAAIATLVSQFFGLWVISALWVRVRPAVVHQFVSLNPLQALQFFRSIK